MAFERTCRRKCSRNTDAGSLRVRFFSVTKATGLAVHVGARVAALAEPGEVLVTSTVKQLVGGSEIGFASRGAHTLKGVADQWELFAVVS